MRPRLATLRALRPVGLVVVLFGSCWATCHSLDSCWQDLGREAAQRKAEEEAKRAAEMEEARRQDEAYAAQNAAKEHAARAVAQAVHDNIVSKYAKMPPWQRGAEVNRVCSAYMPCAKPLDDDGDEKIEAYNGGDYCCRYNRLLALVESVKGTPEEARLKAATEAVKARHDAAVTQANRSLKCCDGTLSPSCLCVGNHQGCCSHHGGVCGCE